jgi:hypothetical protein
MDLCHLLHPALAIGLAVYLTSSDAKPDAAGPSDPPTPD